MADRVVRITVTAVADPTMRGIFTSMADAADRAQRKVTAGAKRSAKEQAKATEEALSPKKQGSPYREQIRQSDQAIKDFERAETRKTAIAKREQQIRDRIKDNTFRKMQADEERADRQVANQSQQQRRTWGRDFGRSTVGNIGQSARAVMGGVGQVARGAGIDASLGGLTQRVMAAEGAATRATLSGFAAANAKRKGKGEATQAATSGDIQATLKATRSAGDETAISYGDMAAGLEAFVSKSGDLELGKTMLLELGKIAQATGSNFVELADAAGDISIGLGDMPAEEKIRKMGDALRLVATQGSQGTVEIKDMATLMARLVSPATRTSSDFQVGLSEAGAIAQMSRMGGATTANEQAMSATAFTRDLTKRANLKRYEEQGFNVFANKEHTQIRGIQDIIVDVFKKTNGDLGQITELFPNEASKRAVMGMHQTYTDAGGGDAGIEAIKAKFKEFSSAMSKEDVEGAAKLVKNSKAGNAQAMQNRFETTWADALDKIAPAMEKLAPHVGTVADKFASLVVYMAENPGKAIVGAIVASIGKAAIGTAVSNSIANWVQGAPRGPGGAPGAPASGGPGAAIGGIFTVIAAAVAITAIGVELIANEVDRKNKVDDAQRIDRQSAGIDADNALLRVQQGRSTPEDEERKLRLHQAELEAKVKQGEEAPGIVGGQVRPIRDVVNWATGSGPSFEATAADKDAQRNLEANQKLLGEVKAAIEGLKSANLNVTVSNMPAAGLAPGIGASGTGRTGPEYSGPQ